MSEVYALPLCLPVQLPCSEISRFPSAFAVCSQPTCHARRARVVEAGWGGGLTALGRAVIFPCDMGNPDGAARAQGESGRAYLYMLLGSLAFASMGALSHAAAERCDWRLVAVARSSLSFVFIFGLSLAAGVRLVFFRPALLWVRSVAGGVGVRSEEHTSELQSL